MEKRYRALRIIATIFKIVGWVVLILGILTACATSGMVVLSGGSALMRPIGIRGEGALVGSIVAAVVSFALMMATVGLYALLLIAISEGIQVFLDIEANTRMMAARLGQKAEPPESAPPS